MSILRFLLLMLLSIITLVSFTAALAGYNASIERAEQLFDENLQNFTQSLVALPDSDSLTAIEIRGMALQIWRGNSLLIKSADAPTSTIVEAAHGFGEANFNGQRWRTFSWEDRAHVRTIMVAEPLSRRIELAESVALASLTPLVFAVPMLALLIALTIARGLSPLKKLSQRLRYRQANDFTAVTLENSPAELRPVVDTINRLLARVEAAFEREKRFSADAAHELRTPISVLQVGIHNLTAQHPELATELGELGAGVQRMSHVVEQILQLSRTHPDHFKANFQPLSLTELCQQSISHCYESIDRKQQTIELEHQPAVVSGDSFALLTMLNNLILNASKYSPDGGSIRVSVDTPPSGIRLRIEDSGPGIKAQDYERVLDRFYRSGGDQHASDIAGCGLGMAIVKQVVDLHSATIRLGRSSSLGGLEVIVQFPTDMESRS